MGQLQVSPQIQKVSVSQRQHISTVVLVHHQKEIVTFSKSLFCGNVERASDTEVLRVWE